MVDIVTKQEASRYTKDWGGISDRQERLVELGKSALIEHPNIESHGTHIRSTLRHDMARCALFIRGFRD